MPNTPASTQPTYAYLAKPTAARLDILADQCLRILCGGNVTADAPWDRREVKLLCEQTLVSLQGEIDRLNTERVYKDAIDREAFAKAQYFNDMEAIYKYGGTSDDHIVTLEDWPVFTDANGYAYALLPDSYVNIKRDQVLPGEEQVRAVEPMRRVDTAKRRYVPLSNGQHHLISDGGGFYYDEPRKSGILAYYREGPKLLFRLPLGVAMPDEKVRIKFTLRPERDQLPSPGLLQDAQDDMVIPKVVGLLMRKGPEDKVNDNNPTV